MELKLNWGIVCGSKITKEKMLGWQHDRGIVRVAQLQEGNFRIILHACISCTINKQIVNSFGKFKLTLLHGGIPYIPAMSAA